MLDTITAPVRTAIAWITAVLLAVVVLVSGYAYYTLMREKSDLQDKVIELTSKTSELKIANEQLSFSNTSLTNQLNFKAEFSEKLSKSYRELEEKQKAQSSKYESTIEALESKLESRGTADEVDLLKRKLSTDLVDIANGVLTKSGPAAGD